MMGRIAFPFLTLSNDAVQAGHWQIALNDGEFRPASDYLANWDASSSVRVRRQLSMDTKLAAAELGIRRKQLRLSVVVGVGSGPGRLPRYTAIGQQVDVDSKAGTVNLEFTLGTVSMVIHLRTDVILADVPREADQLAPSNLGDRLWTDRQMVRIEGQELRFPVEATDFQGMFGDPTVESAPWFAHWTPGDWTRDFHGAFRLFLNSGVPAIRKLLDEDEPNTLIFQAIVGDVMSQLCEALLCESHPPAEIILDKCERETVGGQIRHWLKLAWPGRDLDFVRQVLQSKPNHFRATLVAAAKTSQTGD